MRKLYFTAQHCFDFLFGLATVIILNTKYFLVKTKLPLAKKNVIHILGNGPSIGVDMDRIRNVRKNSSVMAVNSFAKTRLYREIRPDFYLIADPGFFFPKSERVSNIAEETMRALIDDTEWELSLFVPIKATSSEFVKCVTKNVRVQVFFFKNIPFLGESSSFSHFLFKYKLANPIIQNVLTGAIFLAVQMGFKSIGLWGADHSWMENYYVGTDNALYSRDPHFYSDHTKDKDIKLLDPSGIERRLHDEFVNMAIVFKSYHVLANYANYRDCTIYNSSSKTWIDAFTRVQSNLT